MTDTVEVDINPRQIEMVSVVAHIGTPSGLSAVRASRGRPAST
jgi:hypothetical protein